MARGYEKYQGGLGTIDCRARVSWQRQSPLCPTPADSRLRSCLHYPSLFSLHYASLSSLRWYLEMKIPSQSECLQPLPLTVLSRHTILLCSCLAMWGCSEPQAPSLRTFEKCKIDRPPQLFFA